MCQVLWKREEEEEGRGCAPKERAPTAKRGACLDVICTDVHANGNPSPSPDARRGAYLDVICADVHLLGPKADRSCQICR